MSLDEKTRSDIIKAAEIAGREAGRQAANEFMEEVAMRVARETARETVSTVFVMLDVAPDQNGIRLFRDRMRFLSQAHEGTRQVQKVTAATLFSTITAGVIWLIWEALR